MDIASTTIAVPPVVSQTTNVIVGEIAALWFTIKPFLPQILAAIIIVFVVRWYHRRTWEKRG